MSPNPTLLQVMLNAVGIPPYVEPATMAGDEAVNEWRTAKAWPANITLLLGVMVMLGSCGPPDQSFVRREDDCAEQTAAGVRDGFFNEQTKGAFLEYCLSYIPHQSRFRCVPASRFDVRAGRAGCPSGTRAQGLVTIPAANQAAAARAQAARNQGHDPLAVLGFPTVHPMAPQEAAALKSRIDATLATSPSGSRVFKNVTDLYGGAVKHTPSGLICRLGNPGMSVEGDAHSAVCRDYDGLRAVEVRVRRASTATLDEAADQVQAELQREPGYAPFKGKAFVAPRPKAPRRTLRFTSRVDGRAQHSRVMVALIAGWVLTERSIGPPPPSDGFDPKEAFAQANFGSQIIPPSGARSLASVGQLSADRSGPQRTGTHERMASSPYRRD